MRMIDARENEIINKTKRKRIETTMKEEMYKKEWNRNYSISNSGSLEKEFIGVYECKMNLTNSYPHINGSDTSHTNTSATNRVFCNSHRNMQKRQFHNRVHENINLDKCNLHDEIRKAPPLEYNKFIKKDYQRYSSLTNKMQLETSNFCDKTHNKRYINVKDKNFNEEVKNTKTKYHQIRNDEEMKPKIYKKTEDEEGMELDYEFFCNTNSHIFKMFKRKVIDSAFYKFSHKSKRFRGAFDNCHFENLMEIIPFTLITAYVYFISFLEEVKQHALESYDFINIFLSCCLVSSKFWDDVSLTNDKMSFSFRVRVEDLNSAEQFLLKTLDYKLDINNERVRSCIFDEFLFEEIPTGLYEYNLFDRYNVHNSRVVSIN